MGITKTVKKVVMNPKLVGRAFNRHWYRFRYGDFYSDGIDVFERDWDNLILLDACRYDLFEQVVDLDGDLTSVQSKGTNTIQFLKGNLRGKTLNDTVYITANPQFHKIRDELDCEFHAVIPLWEDQWNDDAQTVLPETTASAALSVAEEYPQKRLFIHFDQPHIPFIGEGGSDMFDMEKVKEHPLPFWQQPMSGIWDVTEEEIWDSYAENLQIALRHVESLLRDLPGKTVVTSDHGNLISERVSPIPIREYGHPPFVYTEELITVPWFVTKWDRRKEITSQASVSRPSAEADIEDRLAALGYK